MKKLFRYALVACTMLTAGAAYADSTCEIGIGIQPIMEGENVPANVARQLETKLKQALSYVGVAAGDYDCQFFLTGKFETAYSQEQSGPGGRVLVKSNVVLAICDGENKKVYAMATFPIKGVGASDEQALIRGLQSLNARNAEFARFVEEGKNKIVNYFDVNYPTYISKAQSALKARNYDEALYWSSSVPECCNGYDEARALINTCYQDKVNYDGAMLLSQAQAAWAADPTSAGAAEAGRYLAQIDPSSSSYAGAKVLASKMAASVKADIDFETKEKYRTQVALEKQRIEAARQAAVEWARNQPKTIVRNNWIVW